MRGRRQAGQKAGITKNQHLELLELLTKEGTKHRVAIVKVRMADIRGDAISPD